MVFDEYTYRLEDATEVVMNWSQLERAVDSCEDDDVIFIPGHVHIKTDERLNLGGVTLASEGATLERPEPFDGPFLKSEGGELDGLRFIGPDDKKIGWPGYKSGHINRAVELEGRAVARNCVVKHWGHAGFTVGRSNKNSVATVDRCRITENFVGGLGYGIETDAGVRVRNCYLNDNRHSVAADGNPDGVWWSIRGCHIGPDTRLHAIDTHNPGIQHIEFVNNYSEVTTNETVRVRGEVREGGVIADNWFQNERFNEHGDEDSALRIGPSDRFEKEDVTLKNNVFSKDDPRERLGKPLV